MYIYMEEVSGVLDVLDSCNVIVMLGNSLKSEVASAFSFLRVLDVTRVSVSMSENIKYSIFPIAHKRYNQTLPHYSTWAPLIFRDVHQVAQGQIERGPSHLPALLASLLCLGLPHRLYFHLPSKTYSLHLPL